MAVYQLLPLLLLFPLIGALINGTIGKNLSEKTVGSIATIMTAIPFVIALMIFFQLGDEPVKSVLFPILRLDSLHIDAALYADNLSIWMTMVVTGVGALIHLYSIGYMHGDKGFYKFFTYLNLFIFSMLVLILGSNYFMLYFGWEGVGVCSYLLIGYYYSDEKDGLLNSKAGRKSFIINRIGDLGLFIAFALMLKQFGSLEYDVVGQQMLAGSLPTVFMATMITLALFVGATGKSAQIPLFTWLPDAMAGPTPISALIHAATMVTAGIFLMVRSNFLLEYAPQTKEIILYVGLATSLVAAFIALRQNDIKKILAYSTVSQLGLIFVAIGLGAYTVAIFHVTTHAFFKALLFLGAGSVIHAMGGEQNIRKMGGLKDKIKTTHLTFFVGTLAISGFPLLSGFFSKDEILSYAFESSVVLYIALIISSALTAIYMFRLYYVVFHGKFRDSKDVETNVHESPMNMTLPLQVLAVLSIIGGIINLPGLFLKGKTAHYLDNLLNGNVLGLSRVHVDHPEFGTTLVLLVVAIVVFAVAMAFSNAIYNKKGIVPQAEDQYTGWEKLSNKKLYWDEAYDFLFVKPIEGLSKAFYTIVDGIILSGLVQGIAKTVALTGDTVRKWQDGKVNSYILWMVFGIIGFVVYFLIKI